MLQHSTELLPPGWGALTLLPARRRRRGWPRMLTAAGVAAATIAWAIYLR